MGQAKLYMCDILIYPWYGSWAALHAWWNSGMGLEQLYMCDGYLIWGWNSFTCVMDPWYGLGSFTCVMEQLYMCDRSLLWWWSSFTSVMDPWYGVGAALYVWWIPGMGMEQLYMCDRSLVWGWSSSICVMDPWYLAGAALHEETSTDGPFFRFVWHCCIWWIAFIRTLAQGIYWIPLRGQSLKWYLTKRFILGWSSVSVYKDSISIEPIVDTALHCDRNCHLYLLPSLGINSFIDKFNNPIYGLYYKLFEWFSLSFYIIILSTLIILIIILIY